VSARDHQSHREDAGAYLLGALPDLERQAFEGHLRGCAECREEVDRLRHAVHALPRSVEQLEPPPGLRATLLAEVYEEDRGPGLFARLLAAPARMRPAMALAGAAAVLAIGLLGGLGLSKALTGDDVHTLTAGAGNATLTLTGDGEHGAILRVNELPKPSGGDVYQAWVQHGDEMTPEPTFEVDDNGRGAVAVPDDLSSADAVLVTREKRGGATAPSGAPLLRVGL
jgi:anti-sigma-K factor RskA